MNKSQTLYFTIYILFLIHIFLVNYKSKNFYKILTNVLSRNNYYIYLFLTLIIAMLSIYLLKSEKYNTTSTVIITIFLLVLPLYFLKTKMLINYSSKTANVYRKNIDSMSNTNTAILQLTEMPIYCKDGNEVGKFYSSADLITRNDDNKTNVTQNIMYIFNGNMDGYPKGIINMMIYFENDVNGIFPKDGDYKGHITSGTESYTDISGHVIISVRGDKRDATFYFD